MYYSLICHDFPNSSEKRKRLRENHIDYLNNIDFLDNLNCTDHPDYTEFPGYLGLQTTRLHGDPDGCQAPAVDQVQQLHSQGHQTNHPVHDQNVIHVVFLLLTVRPLLSIPF